MTAKSSVVFSTASLCIYVENIHDAVTFYSKVFGFEGVGLPNDGQAILSLGPLSIFLVANHAVRQSEIDDVEAPPAGLPQGSELVISVRPEEIDDLHHAAILAGATKVAAESQNSDVFVRDLDGFLIRLRSFDRADALEQDSEQQK